MEDNSKLPFYVSYQDPKTLCYTRKPEEKERIVRIHDLLLMKKEQLDKFDITLEEEGNPQNLGQTLPFFIFLSFIFYLLIYGFT